MNNYDIFENKTNLINRFFQDLKALLPNVTKEIVKEILENDTAKIDLTNQNEYNNRVINCIIDKYRRIYRGEVLNHTTFKLSELDLEMIKYVPQGGNWKNIPSETIKKSKRLLRISETGGRTTLYGRIDYRKPSYTITTYFNRPGNGTYVHPVHERVISVREAARFQCFPDEYYFYGSKADKLKQIGNAVPCLLAYKIGKAIVEKTGCHTSVDLFSGAGGMTYGFKRAGIKAVVATDIIENACTTLKINNPEINVLCGDVTKEEVKNKIIKYGIESQADIICGGPPCQGFSMAGFRNENDPRNLLFKPFVEIVSKVNPKIIVFENVEGILSYKNGETYRNIIELFSSLGYQTEGRKLMASHYGVPQKRKRVIILCVRKDLLLNPSEIFPNEVTPNVDKQISAYETIYDLDGVECGDNPKYNSDYTSDILRVLKGKESIESYFNKIYDKRGKITLIEDEEDEQLSLDDEEE